MNNQEKISIGFIGIGVMGHSMARHLLKKGYSVVVHNRTEQKAKALIDEGATWAGSPKQVAEHSDVIISIVGYPADVEEIYLGETGILAGARSGSTLIDMTTSTPALAQKIYNQAKSKNIHSLDAPVSGGDVGAKNAALSIMVGGELDTFQTMLPIFQCMGKIIEYQGPAGSGQLTKLTNQIIIASSMVGLSEALVFAKKAGLNPDTVLKSISQGAAASWGLSNLVPRMIADDMEPGFYIKHFLKDMNIALEAASEMNLELPGLKQAKALYQKLVEDGFENKGTQALVKYYT